MDEPTWERRYRAPVVGMPDWALERPERLAYTSTDTGVWQAHVLDLSGGERRQVSDHPVGVLDALMVPDGSRVAWWIDEDGDESGTWWTQPFEGGESVPLLRGVPERAWNGGLAMRAGTAAAALSDATGFMLFAGPLDGELRALWRSPEAIALGGGDQAHLGGLSSDGTLVAVEHGEGNDEIHRSLRVFDASSGEVAGERGEHGVNTQALCWSPVPGDQRLAYVDERADWDLPWIWDVATDEHRQLRIDLPGNFYAVSWWPDASALLVTRLHEGSHSMFRYDLATDALSPIGSLVGQMTGERVRPDGAVWYRRATGAEQPRVYEGAGTEVVPPAGDAAPPGRPYTSWRFENEHGQQVHGFYVTPEGEGPWPLMMYVHGGPTWLHEDRWEPQIQSYVDAGFAVGMVNYRGSTGYGRAWRDAIVGDIGGCDVEDVNAGFRDLVERGIGDPTRAVVCGWSWGGYVTLMELGTHADMWRCGMAGIPVGDYEMGYAELSPNLQAYDRALLGGTPSEVPELMATRNPIVHADNVTAPVMFVIGEHDSRCPYRQAMAYVDRLRERGHPTEVYTFATGHGSYDISEDVRQQRAILDFLKANVPGLHDV